MYSSRSIQLLVIIEKNSICKQVDISNVSERIAVGVLYRTDSLSEPVPTSTSTLLPVPAEHVLLSAHDPRVRSLCLRVLLRRPQLSKCKFSH